MAVCLNPQCLSPLPEPNKLFQTCRVCLKVSCDSCKAIHEGQSCGQYKTQQNSGEKTILAKAYQELPVRASASFERSAPGISLQESWPKQGTGSKFVQEDAQTSLGIGENLSLENIRLDGEILAQCRMEGCSGAAVISAEDQLFRCPTCQHFTCVSCCVVHESMTCDEFREKNSVSTNVINQVSEQATSASPASSLTSVEEEDDGEGVIVDCRQGTCKGYGYVEKSATMAQCGACKHWTCRQCKASHEGVSCEQYKQGMSDDEYPADPKGHNSNEGKAGIGITVQCIRPNCGSTFKVERSTIQCPNMCGGQCCICPTCNLFMCIKCNPSHNRKGFLETVKGIFYKKEGMQVAEGRASQGAVPKQGKGLQPQNQSTAESTSTSNKSAALDYRKCKNILCLKYGAPHEGPCQVRSDGHCDKDNKALDDQESCDSCRKTKYAMMIKACEHHLCKACIEELVENAYEDEIACPVTQSSGRCSGFLVLHDIKQNVTRQTYHKYTTMLSWERMQCHSRKCQAQFRVQSLRGQVKCPKCRVENCLDCRACHAGKTCKKYMKWYVNAMDRGMLEDAAEKQKRLRDQEQLYKKDFVPNNEEFDCVICYSVVEPGKGLLLKNCHHRICKDCLVGTIEQSESADVRCPCIAEGDQPCTMNILDDEIKGVLSAEGYEAFLEKGFREAERKAANSFHCKTTNCRGWCIYEPEVNAFHCPICEMINCLRCEAIHPNVTCEVYQEDLKRRAANDAAAQASMQYLMDQLEQGVAMRCPTCKVIVIKRSGCDYIACASCLTGLCWATKGARWGPKGKGDTSGGCRCGVNGQKCHPACTTCH